MSAVIETKNLSYVYSQGMPDEKLAVDNVSISVEKGELVGIIGHTGSGKSTLIQHLNGLLKPTSGSVLVDGEDIWKNKDRMREFRFKVGLVFQYPEYQLFEETIYKDIAFGPKNMGLSDGEIRDRVLSAARFVGIGEDMMERSPFELSGGQKRRAAIAGVLAMDPEVLVLDEPTAGLDPAGCDEILGEIKSFHRQRGTTVLLVSHSMDDVASFADRVLVINRGGVFCFDTVENVFARASELQSLGLSIPTVTGILLELRRRGIPVQSNAFTAESAARIVLDALERSRADA